ncbi:hypothetical protein [Sagittula sp. S175]|uniref:hypothetical protein n=1 Tax=Sagittula sp. S175 TaxID=3415129 RepID=UPI003C7D7508
MATKNHIGKTLYVAQALPATNNAAGFEALTWVQVKGIQTLPVLGVTHATIDVPDLATGFTIAVKGAASGQDTPFTFRDLGTGTLDAGQADAIEQANDAQGLMSVKIVTGSGTDSGDGPAPVTGDPVEYAQGFAHSYVPNTGDTSGHEGGSVTFRQNNFTVSATEPA